MGRHMQTFRRIRWTIAAVLLVLYLPGCYSWKTVPITPVVSEQRPGRVRVTTAEGTRFELHWPLVRGDTLLGTRRDLPVSIALGDIARVQARQIDTGKSVALSVMLAGLAAASVYSVLHYSLPAQYRRPGR